jgi:hypothetical protein
MPGCFNTPWHVEVHIFDAPGCLNPPWHVELRVFDAPGCFNTPWHVEIRVIDAPQCFTTLWHVFDALRCLFFPSMLTFVQDTKFFKNII